jgi:hypothetical protein
LFHRVSCHPKNSCHIGEPLVKTIFFDKNPLAE